MRRRAMRSAALLGAALLAGCAYYNGLYNANHLAVDARKAEREGRSGEARSLWARAAVKAESVVTRYPHSKYRDEALLLQGVALLRIDAYTQAVVPLTLAIDSGREAATRREARLLLGQCRYLMAEPDSAVFTLTPLLTEADSTLVSRARWWLGRAELAMGRMAAAEAHLVASREPEAVFDRVRALMRLGRADTAVATLRAIVRGPYADSVWLPALDSVGRLAPLDASALVDALLARDDLTRGQRGRLLLDDGRRWIDSASDHAAVRFAAVVETAPDSIEARVARAYVGVTALRHTASLDSVPVLLRELQDAIHEGGAPAMVAGRIVDWMQAFTGHVVQREGDDLDLFLLAETTRDSVRARPLAGRVFELLSERYPASPIAPKSLLAASILDAPHADSLVRVVRERYPASPYTLALSGQGGAAYAALEDSLRTVLLDRLASPRARRAREVP